MTDFGDDVGSMVFSQAQNETQRFIAKLQYGNYSRTKTEKGESYCTIPFDSDEQAKVVEHLLKKEGIKFERNNEVGEHGAITINQKDLSKVKEVISEIKPDEYIKSHDGMDLDKSTLHNEVDTPEEYGFSWKEDINEKVYNARMMSTTPEEFAREVEIRGIKVTEAVDGEFMFVHPSGDHLKVRADTLNELFKKESFADGYDLDSVAKEAREASKELNAATKTKDISKEIPSFQQQTR